MSITCPLPNEAKESNSFYPSNCVAWIKGPQESNLRLDCMSVRLSKDNEFCDLFTDDGGCCSGGRINQLLNELIASLTIHNKRRYHVTTQQSLTYLIVGSARWMEIVFSAVDEWSLAVDFTGIDFVPICIFKQVGFRKFCLDVYISVFYKKRIQGTFFLRIQNCTDRQELDCGCPLILITVWSIPSEYLPGHNTRNSLSLRMLFTTTDFVFVTHVAYFPLHVGCLCLHHRFSP